MGREISKLPGVNEAAVISTCNRFEIYFAADNAFDGARQVTEFLHRYDNYVCIYTYVYTYTYIIMYIQTSIPCLHACIHTQSQTNLGSFPAVKGTICSHWLRACLHTHKYMHVQSHTILVAFSFRELRNCSFVCIVYLYTCSYIHIQSQTKLSFIPGLENPLIYPHCVHTYIHTYIHAYTITGGAQFLPGSWELTCSHWRSRRVCGTHCELPVVWTHWL